MQNRQRRADIKNFLEKKCGLKGYQILDMGFDASTRKYFRINLKDGSTKILVDDEGCHNRPKEFVALSDFLIGNGIRAPKVFAQDLRKGLLLIEDFGESDFVKKATPENERELLKKAVDILIKLHQVSERPQCVKDMDSKIILDNFALFTDWYVPACLGRQLTPLERKSFFDIVKNLMPAALKVPSNVVLWDYHVNNVMYPDEGDAAVIDFQDALWGPGLYDLASLIEDERRDIPQRLTKELKEYYFKQMKTLDRQDFEKAYNYMALLRHLRVLGRFTTLVLVRKRKGYAKYIPHGLELVKHSLENPEFKALKEWMQNCFPESFWGAPKDKEIIKGFVLAAGRGTRMRHLTDNKPKPMINIAGRKLMDYGLDLLKNAKIKDIVVNVCYRKCMIKKHVKSLKCFNATFSEETELLETGGGIKKALRYFGNQAFFVINADNILIDDGYKPILYQMQDSWDEHKYDVMLLLCDIRKVKGDAPEHGDYKIVGEMPVRNKEKIISKDFNFGYVGVAILHPRLFDGVKEKKFSLVKLFDKAEENGRLGCFISDRQEFWVGTPEAVTEVDKILQKKNNP